MHFAFDKAIDGDWLEKRKKVSRSNYKLKQKLERTGSLSAFSGIKGLRVAWSLLPLL